MISIKKRIYIHIFFMRLFKKIIILKFIFFQTIQLYMKMFIIYLINSN